MPATVPILRSKLYRPPVTADFVVRDARRSRLEAGCRQPLTLVSALAGYRKTSLVSHWLESCEIPAAWLSLDETDGDAAVFLHYFVAAIRTLCPDACGGTLTLLNAPELPPVPVLALDDYYRLRESAALLEPSSFSENSW